MWLYCRVCSLEGEQSLEGWLETNQVEWGHKPFTPTAQDEHGTTLLNLQRAPKRPRYQ